MKKLIAVLSVIIAFALLFGLMSLSASASGPSGKWTEQDLDTTWYSNYTDNTSYNISSAAQLASVAKLVNGGTASFEGKILEISADIDLSAHYWVPIGTPEHPFKGTVKASSAKTISGLFIDSSSAVSSGGARYYGFVGYGEGMTLTNLTLSGSISVSYLASNTDIVGAAAAFAGKNSTTDSEVSKLVNETTITVSGSSELKAGGVVGLSDNSKLSGCTNNGKISVNSAADATVGGLIGKVNGNTAIAGNGGGGSGDGGASSGPSRNNAALDITAESAAVGGIVGKISGGELSITTRESARSTSPEEYAKYVWSMGEIKVMPSLWAKVGGFIGAIEGGGSCDLRGATFIQNITVGKTYDSFSGGVGAILGFQDATAKSTLTECSFTTGLTVKSGTATLISENNPKPKLTVISTGEIYTGGIFGKASHLVVFNPMLGSEAGSTSVPVISSYGRVGGLGGMSKAGAVYTEGSVHITKLSVQSLGSGGSVGGFFGEANGLKDFNAVAESLEILSSQSDACVGAVVGSFSGEADGSNIFVLGSISAASTGDRCNIGGFAGISSGTLENISLGDHTTIRTAAGQGCSMGSLVGTNSGTVKFCNTSAELKTTTADNEAPTARLSNLMLGGLAGTNSGTIADSYYNMPVIMKSLKNEDVLESCVGGFVGSNSGTVQNSYTVCNVDVSGVTMSPVYAGGFIGCMDGGSVENCYAADCAITGGSVDGAVGGFAGRYGGAARVTNCYSAMSVSGGSVMGGFFGRFDSVNANNVTSCVYLSYGDVNSSLDAAGSASLLDSAVKAADKSALSSKETFAGWNFSALWHISNSEDAANPYPTLARSYGEKPGINFDIRWYTENPDADEFTIIDEGDLVGFGALVNSSIPDIGAVDFAGKTITVGKPFNIQLSAWTPIASSSNEFKGEFDGADKLIDGVKDNPLFDELSESAVLKNVYLEAWNINTVYNAGAFASVNRGEIENASLLLSGGISASSGNAGAVAGDNKGEIIAPKLSFCEGALISAKTCGGVAGTNSGKISNAVFDYAGAAAFVSSDEANARAGGVVGINEESGEITLSCLEIARPVAASGENGGAGGVAGENRGAIKNSVITIAENTIINAAHNTGIAGGIAAFCSGLVESSSVKGGTVEAVASAGGISGKLTAGEIKSSSAETIRVKSPKSAGGLVGLLTGGAVNSSEAKNLFVSGSNAIGGALGTGELSLTANRPCLDGVTVSGATLSSDSGGAVKIGGAIGCAKGVMAVKLAVNDLTLNASDAGTTICAGGLAGAADGSVIRDSSGSALNITVRNNSLDIYAGGAAGSLSVSSDENKTYTLKEGDKLGVYQGLTNVTLTGLNIKATGAEGAIGAKKALIGGLVGKTEKGSVYDCAVKGSVEADGFNELFAGGAAGAANEAYLVNNSIECGVKLGSASEYKAGGFAGALENSTVRFNKAGGALLVIDLAHELTATNVYAGGFVGYADNDADWAISENRASQAVSAACKAPRVYVGGFAGLIGGTKHTTAVYASSASASCSAVGSDIAYVGGFAGGINGSVDSSYSSGGSVTANAKNAYSGGFAGIIPADAKVTNCYAVDSDVYAVGSDKAVTAPFAAENNGALKSVYAVLRSANTKLGEETSFTSQATYMSEPSNIYVNLTNQPALSGFDFDSSDRKWCYVSRKNSNRPVLTAMESSDAWPDFNYFRREGLGSISVASADEFGWAARLLNDEGFAKLLSDGRAARSDVILTLTASINLNNVYWRPINELRAGDVLDGNNNTISGLNLNAKNFDNLGLVETNGGTIRNLTVSGATINAGNTAGVLAGTNKGAIENVSVVASNVSGSGNVGALVGVNQGNIKKIGVDAKTAVKGETAGGIAGVNESGGSISENIVSEANIVGTSAAGGIVGVNKSGAAIGAASPMGDVTSNGAVSAPTVGGVAGINEDGGTVQNSDTICAEYMLQDGSEAKGRIVGLGTNEANCREGQCAAPAASPYSKSFTETVRISLSTATEGAQIRYTLDGSTPTSASALYETPFEIDKTTTIKAVAVKAGFVDSSILSVTYTKLSSGSGGGGGGGGGEAAEPEAIIITGGGESVKMTVEINGTSAVVKNTALDGLIDTKNADKLSFDISTKGEAVTELVLPSDMVNELAKAASDTKTALGVAEIKLSAGTVKLDGETLAEAARSSKDLSVAVVNNADGSISFNVTAGGILLDSPIKAEWTAADDKTPVLVKADGSENVIKKSVAEGGKVYAEIPSGAKVKFVDSTHAFPDVQSGAWYEPSVRFVSERSLFNGTDKGFEPNTTMSRAMLATVIYRLEDAKVSAGVSFDDVEKDSWYADAVAWASAENIVTGTGRGFAPNEPVSREQIAVMFYRYSTKLGLDTSGKVSLDSFADGSEASSWAEDALQWAVSSGLFKGNERGALNPKANATRAEVAELLRRMVRLMVE